MTRRRQQLIIIGSVVAVAIVAAVVVVLASGSSPAADLDYMAMNPQRLDDGSFVIGNPEAPITIVEFADFACPACQQYKPDIDRFIEDYVMTGQARFEFRIFPTAGGALTDFAGQLAECADHQRPGAFWDAHERFYAYATSARYGQEMGRTLANDLDLDYAEMLECTREVDHVQENVQIARNLGVSGTPAVAMRINGGPLQWVTVNGQTYSRGGVPYEALAAVVEQVQ